MRLLITLIAAATAMLAQQPAAKTFTSAADAAAMIAKAKNERKPDQANFIQPLLQAAPYTVNLEYRVGDVAGFRMATRQYLHDLRSVPSVEKLRS